MKAGVGLFFFFFFGFPVAGEVAAANHLNQFFGRLPLPRRARSSTPGTATGGRALQATLPSC
jgi:hypothetical protein